MRIADRKRTVQRISGMRCGKVPPPHPSANDERPGPICGGLQSREEGVGATQVAAYVGLDLRGLFSRQLIRPEIRRRAWVRDASRQGEHDSGHGGEAAHLAQDTGRRSSSRHSGATCPPFRPRCGRSAPGSSRPEIGPAGECCLPHHATERAGRGQPRGRWRGMLDRANRRRARKGAA